MTDTITEVRGRRVWDSRGRPTVEVEVFTAGGMRARAIAPAGASRGSAEASDLRDGGSRLGGLDVLTAISRVHTVIAPALVGHDVCAQSTIDSVLDQLDPTPTREVLGGNATVAASLAVLHTAAAVAKQPLWRYLNPDVRTIPRPEIQIIGGGAHAARRVDLQDFMVIPLSATSIADALVHVAEVYRTVGELFAARGPVLGVADEGGHWPAVSRNEEALELLTTGIERAGFRAGIDVGISLDIAASEFEKDGTYRLSAEDRDFARDEWLAVLHNWMRDYPIVAIEDPASEHDPIGMRAATAAFGTRALIVGDDYIVTNPDRITEAAADSACNTALIKVNQAGTVTRSWQAHERAHAVGWATIVSARSGETEDVSVAHLAVGWGADIVKVGSITRGERTAKWNELIRIDEELGGVPLAEFPHACAAPAPRGG